MILAIYTTSNRRRQVEVHSIPIFLFVATAIAIFASSTSGRTPPLFHPFTLTNDDSDWSAGFETQQ
jgi:hypothetical protein